MTLLHSVHNTDENQRLNLLSLLKTVKCIDTYNDNRKIKLIHCLILNSTRIGRTLFFYLVHFDCTPSRIRLFCEKLREFKLITTKKLKERDCTAVV